MYLLWCPHTGLVSVALHHPCSHVSNINRLCGVGDMIYLMKYVTGLAVFMLLVGCYSANYSGSRYKTNNVYNPTNLQNSNYSSNQKPNNPSNCKGYNGPGGPCYSGPGGTAYDGSGGACYNGPGGPCYSGPGGNGRMCPRVCK